MKSSLVKYNILSGEGVGAPIDPLLDDMNMKMMMRIFISTMNISGKGFKKVLFVGHCFLLNPE